jgi:tetratricopeptide (TPR) repeat protein
LVVAGFGLVHVLALMLSIFVNLHSFQANGLTRVFNGYVKAGQYSAALEVGKHLLELDPWQDAYFLGVADATVDSADSLSGQQGIVQYLMAEKYYKQAFSLNPLYYHNIIGMAHIYRLWARASSDPVMRESRAAQSEQFYADALEGKPYRVKLWVEWADLRDEFGDPQGARQKIDIALKMDDTYAPAYELSARLYLTDAEKQNDPLKRAELLNKAAKDLTAEIEMMNRREENPSLVLMQLGDLYTRLQQYDKAREAYLQAEKLDLGHSQWQVYRNLAEVSGKLNDIAAQREYLKQAIASAPAEESQSLQAILDAIKP